MCTTSWHEQAAKLAIDGRAVIDGFRAEARFGERKRVLIRFADLMLTHRNALASRRLFFTRAGRYA